MKHRATRPAFGLLVTLSISSWPIGPSITFCMCSVLRNRYGMLKTLRSSTTGPRAPTLTRANWIAPTCACSIASFSPPSCIDGYIWMDRRPLVAFSSFLPMFSTATTVGYPSGCTSEAFITILDCAAAGPAAAQSKMVMKASDVHPEGYPTVVAVENMGKKLEKATNGRLSIQMYPSMQLGGEKEAIEQAQVGAIQFARISVGALGPVIDDLNVFNMPYLFRNTEHMQKVIDGPIGQELMDKVTNNPKAGLVALCFMDAGARSLYDTKKPIRNLADLKGMKFRVMGNPMFVDMMNSLGGNGVSMGYDQVFNALQTGVVDGAENNPPSFVFDNHYQVAKFYTIDEHLIVPEMVVFSKKTWDCLL